MAKKKLIHLVSYRQFQKQNKYLKGFIKTYQVDIKADKKYVKTLKLNEQVIFHSRKIIDYIKKESKKSTDDKNDSILWTNLFAIEFMMSQAYFDIKIENGGKLPKTPFIIKHPEPRRKVYKTPQVVFLEKMFLNQNKKPISKIR
jgi:hypothetical protein